MAEKTLLGFIGKICKDLSKRMSESNSSIATTQDVKDIISQTITKTYIDSLSAVSSEPTELVDSNGTLLFFANGTPITISAREDSEDGAVITWNGGEKIVEKATNIFGGRHDDDTPTNSSIVMNGGSIKNIFGGGLHKSHTVIAKIVMNDGKAVGVEGAGASSFTKTCGCANGTSWYAGDPTKSPCVTDEASVTINGGTISSTLYGGPEGIGYCKKATVVVNDGSAYYVTAVGSNGRTDSASCTIYGGTIEVLQGMNRGTSDDISVTVNGGDVKKAFAGGEIPFVGSIESPNGNDASGSFKKAVLTINGGNVEEVSAGGNDYLVIEEGDPSVEIIDNR